jgi:hypothetical protein
VLEDDRLTPKAISKLAERGSEPSHSDCEPTSAYGASKTRDLDRCYVRFKTFACSDRTATMGAKWPTGYGRKLTGGFRIYHAE